MTSGKATGTYQPGKPDPYTFNLLLQRMQAGNPTLDLKPENVIVLEDQPSGAHAARRMGAQAVLCPDPQHFKLVDQLHKLRQLENDHPCDGAPAVVVVADPDKGWHPVADALIDSHMNFEGTGAHI